MSNSDVPDEDRRRLAYADRSPTLERKESIAERRAAHGFRELTADERRENIDSNLAALADGTGRHSRKEMGEDATIAAWDYALGTGPFAPSEGKPDAMAATLCIHTVHGWRCVPGCRAHLTSPIETQTIAGVQFSSVPALCAAFEQLLSASAAYLWTWRPDREHCSGPQMEAYRELRRLVAGAGKDVP